MTANAFRIVVTPPKSDGFHTIDDEHQAEIVTRRVRESLADARIEADVRKVRHVPPPSRFHATPAEVDAFLREHFAEDVLLRYQWAVGDRAAEEAAKEQRSDTNLRQLEGQERLAEYGRELADLIDPIKGGGHYPSKLVDFQQQQAALVRRMADAATPTSKEPQR